MFKELMEAVECGGVSRSLGGADKAEAYAAMEHVHDTTWSFARSYHVCHEPDMGIVMVREQSKARNGLVRRQISHQCNNAQTSTQALRRATSNLSLKSISWASSLLLAIAA